MVIAINSGGNRSGIFMPSCGGNSGKYVNSGCTVTFRCLFKVMVEGF